MLTQTIIAAKRDAQTLSADDIGRLVSRFTAGEVTDAQMAAFAMAICIRGMTPEETAALTAAMLDSGDRLPRPADRLRLDKHSTGGLGDKVSLILAPIIAALGYDVPMVSGRGLGLSGGTLDKLESIEGYQTNLSSDEFGRVVQDCGCAIAGATERIAPADRRLYAIRDVTATVPSVPLITASILSKKLAASLDGLVMDVKVGSGAFMSDDAAAKSLANSLIAVAKLNGLPTTALITDMDQPLGRSIGNAVEVRESLQILRGDIDCDLTRRVETLTIELVAAVVSAATGESSESTRVAAAKTLTSGAALERFERMVHCQGGKSLELSIAPPHEIFATASGFVGAIDCQAIGEAVVEMGGGRRSGGEKIDHAVGVELAVQIGDSVHPGDRIATLHVNRDSDRWTRVVANAIIMKPTVVPHRELIRHRLPH